MYELTRAEQVYERVHQEEDNEKDNPNSSRAYFPSSERHLKKKSSGLQFMIDVQFERTRESVSVEAKGSKTVCISNFELL